VCHEMCSRSACEIICVCLWRQSFSLIAVSKIGLPWLIPSSEARIRFTSRMSLAKGLATC
jgi:hypothetical protein